MSAPASRWKLGLFVVAGSALGLGGVAFLGAHELQRATHTAYAYFDEALTGLEEGSPVKFRGVTVGVVDRIRFAPDKKHLEVQAALYDDYLQNLGLRVEGQVDCPLPAELRAQVVMSWVTSTAFVQVDYFPDPPRGPQMLPFPVPHEGSTLRTVPSTAKSLEASVREVLHELPKMASSARELVELLRTELQSARLPEVARRLQEVLTQAERQLAALDEHGTVAAATGALQELRATAASLRADGAPLAVTLRQWAELGRSLQQQLEAAQLGPTAAGLRDASGAIDGIADGVRGELQQLHRALAAIERLAALLERDPGALLYGRGRSPSRLTDDK